MVEELAELGCAASGRVTIASGTVQAALLLPALIRTFSELHPQITIAMHDVAEKVVNEMVLNGAVDFGLGTVPEGDSEIVGTRLITEEFLVVMQCRRPARETRRQLRWNDLAGVPLIGPQRGNRSGNVWKASWCATESSSRCIRTMQEVSLPLTIIGMVEGGLRRRHHDLAPSRGLATSMGLVTRTPLDPVVTREVSLISAKRSLAFARRPAAPRLPSKVVPISPDARVPRAFSLAAIAAHRRHRRVARMRKRRPQARASDTKLRI